MNLPLVCIALRGRTGSQIASDAKEAENLGADVVEVRLDNLWTTEERLQESADSEGTDSSRSEKVEFLVKQLELGEVDFETEFGIISQCTELPMILTCRPQRQGGFYPGNEDQRLEVLRSAISIEPDWIDLEVDITGSVREDLVSQTGEKTKVIASNHTIEGTPTASEIIQDVEDCQEMGDLVKVCYTTANRTDGLRIFEAAWNLKDSGICIALMGLGPGGDWARIHAPMLDQYMVYSSTESGWHLAQQGRINASDLRVAWSILEYA